jgi:Uma2 family endonuclease
MAMPKLAEETLYRPDSPPPGKPLPTMHDLPSEDPEEPGLPDDFHYWQPLLLRETFRPPGYGEDQIYVGSDINLYYDAEHPLWHKRPDWFAVLGQSRLYRQSELRLSYVIWQELLAPYLVVELLSPGTEDADLGRALRDADKTPSKWAVYERILKIPYYLVYSRYTHELKAFGRVAGNYRPLDLAGQRLWLPEADLGVGVWEGAYEGFEGKWLRFFDRERQWLPCSKERRELAERQIEIERKRADAEKERAEAERLRADEERLRADEERRRADAERRRAENLAERLRALGIDPEA